MKKTDKCINISCSIKAINKVLNNKNHFFLFKL